MIKPGSEPEKIKKRLTTLFAKLDSAYPDKMIVGLHKDHKKWGETVSELYKLLGYEDGKSFLEAYGYTYGSRESGRTKNNSNEIIEALRKKYPNGSTFKSADELFEANPEYLPKLKSLKNQSSTLFGLPLGKYLLSIGLIQSKTQLKIKDKTEKQKKDKQVHKAKIPSEFVLSDDNKTILEYKGKGGNIIIPSGIEKINDKVFGLTKINTLSIPKELKELGKYTLIDNKGNCKDIENINIEDDSIYFYRDNIGFYSISNNKKTLIRILDKNIVQYNATYDVVHYENHAFTGCHNLENIKLSEFSESFNEYSLDNNTKVKEIYIPKSVKHLYVKPDGVEFILDEESEYLFKDEDSIYEVLEDQTYKLISNKYFGKGKVLLLDNTKIIGEKAFYKHKNLIDIELPLSVKVIEDEAFAMTGLSEIVLPGHIIHVGKKAFGYNKLTNVKLSSHIEYIASNAFEYCSNLTNINTIEKTDTYSFNEGIIKRKDSKNDFMKFAEKIKKTVYDLSMSSNEHFTDDIYIDEINKIIKINTIFKQQSYNNDLLEERVKCAETLSIGDTLKLRINKLIVEVISADNQSLGELHNYISNVLIQYSNTYKVRKCIVKDITQKSKRSKNAKYALGSIELELEEGGN